MKEDICYHRAVPQEYHTKFVTTGQYHRSTTQNLLPQGSTTGVPHARYHRTVLHAHVTTRHVYVPHVAEQYHTSTCGNRFLWYQELPHNIFVRDMWYKIFLKYHTGVPHSKTTHQYHTAIPHSITQQYHTAIPHRCTTQQNHTSVPHSSNTTQQYHTQHYHAAVPQSSTTHQYHTALPHSSTTQHYHTAVPHSITTQQYHTAAAQQYHTALPHSSTHSITNVSFSLYWHGLHYTHATRGHLDPAQSILCGEVFCCSTCIDFMTHFSYRSL